MNIELAKKVLAQIESHPETWDQGQWHCGTAHCFAGWVQILSGQKMCTDTCHGDAIAALGIGWRLAVYLSHPRRTLPEIRDAIAALESGIIDESGYDTDGYDRDGYDGDGFYRESRMLIDPRAVAAALDADKKQGIGRVPQE